MILQDGLTPQQNCELSRVFRYSEQLSHKKYTEGLTPQQDNYLEYCFRKKRELLKKIKDFDDTHDR